MQITLSAQAWASDIDKNRIIHIETLKFQTHEEIIFVRSNVG